MAHAVLLLLLLVAAGAAAVNETTRIGFACVSRDKDKIRKPFTDQGNVQFIHVPKDGGSSMQVWLSALAKEQKHELKFIVHPSQHRAQSAADNEAQVKGNIGIYAGHKAIGWGYYMYFQHEKNAMYFSVTREPLDRVRSLFFFEATYKNTALSDDFKYCKDILAHTTAAGVHFSNVFWHLLVYDEDFFQWATDKMILQSRYFVPEFLMKMLGLEHNTSGTNTKVALLTDQVQCAVQFTLNHIDALDDITNMNGILQQLQYHAPGVITNTRIAAFPHSNSAVEVNAAELALKNETLEVVARAKLMANRPVQIEYDAYEIFLKIGRSRRLHAMQALKEAKRNNETVVPDNSGGSDHCFIDVNDQQLWLFKDVPEQCTRLGLKRKLPS